MSSPQVDENPYASPKCQRVGAAASTRRRLRWRVIPTTLLYLGGGGGLILSLEMVGLALWMMLFDRERDLFVPRFVGHPLASATLLVIPVLAASYGCLLIVAARRCWRGVRGDWWLAGPLTILGLAIYTVCGSLRMSVFQ
jgi:hypothetical protein